MHYNHCAAQCHHKKILVQITQKHDCLGHATMIYPMQLQYVTITYSFKVIESRRAAIDYKNSLIKVKLYEAKGVCCLNLIWMSLQYSTWPSVYTGANKAFDVASEHAVNSKAISVARNNIEIQVSSALGNPGTAEQRGIKLTAVMTEGGT